MRTTVGSSCNITRVEDLWNLGLNIFDVPIEKRWDGNDPSEFYWIHADPDTSKQAGSAAKWQSDDFKKVVFEYMHLYNGGEM